MFFIKQHLQLRNIAMENVNAFVGLTFNQDENFFIIWQYSARCTLEVNIYLTLNKKYVTIHQITTFQLQDLIFNDEFNLTAEFQASFLKDIIKVHYKHCSSTPPPHLGTRISTHQHHRCTRIVECSNMLDYTILVIATE
jgi:hypothetical protein